MLREVDIATFEAQLDPAAMSWHDAVKAILAIKDGPCIDCGRCYPRCAMDFDHVYGTKLYTIARATNGVATSDYSPNPLNLTVRDLFLEVEKCQLRCSNCHRVATSERRRKKLAYAASLVSDRFPVCQDCDGPIIRQSKRGRVPKRCSDCRVNRSQRTLFEAA